MLPKTQILNQDLLQIKLKKYLRINQMKLEIKMDLLKKKLNKQKMTNYLKKKRKERILKKFQL